MTRIPTSHNVPRRPVSAVLAELAIASGMTGHAVALCFRDFPAPIVCELWRHCTSSMATDEVYHVRTLTDVHKLANRMETVRLVLVHVPRLHNPTAWTLQMSLPGYGRRASCPTIFTNSVSDEPDEDPGATLALQANPHECQALAEWLSLFGGRLAWPDVAGDLEIGADAALGNVLRPGSLAGGSGTWHPRDQEVLRGLLAGACLLRSSEGDVQPGANLTVTVEDYDLVRKLLVLPIVSAASESCDPLAAAMVDRANVYLSVKYSPDPVEQNPFYADDYDSYVNGRSPKRDLVTRREIADLGNIRSGKVRRLVEHLKGQPDGHDRFVRMGLRRRPLAREAWQRASAKTLVQELSSWSEKQVRTHFDRLRKANLVTAERENANGPWQYQLPEELSKANSRFRSLPTPEELTRIGQLEVDAAREE